MRKRFNELAKKFLRDQNVILVLSLVLFTVILSTIFLSLNSMGTTYTYNIGDVVSDDIKSPINIEYVLPKETAIEKRRLAEISPLVFDRDQNVLADKLKETEFLFNTIHEVLKENPPQRSNDFTYQLIKVKEKLPKYYRYDDWLIWDILKHTNQTKIMRSVNKILLLVFDMGLLEYEYDNPLSINNNNVLIRVINSTGENTNISTTADQLKTIEKIQNDLYKICYQSNQNLPKSEIKLIYQIVSASIRPNLKFNSIETKKRIDDVLKTAKPVTALIKRGQMIVRDGDTITADKLSKIEILNKYTASTNFSYIIGVMLIIITLVIISAYFMLDYYNSIVIDKKQPLIIFTLVIAFIVFSFLLSKAIDIQNSDFIFVLLLPISFVTMTIAILLNSKFMATIIGLYIIFFSYILSGGTLPSCMLAMCSGILGIIVIRNVEKRSDFLRGGLLIGVINSIVVIAVGLMQEYSLIKIIKNIEMAAANGIINSFLVMGILPLYENVFGLTTRFKLLELSDLNASIFKNMLIKAPGTYNHSLIVANMAETACEAIGADAILARVGGYYHDIGKLADAKFYVENKSNPNDVIDLSPDDYCKLIISHVSKGIKLAEENNLPESVIDFIKEHHGTSTMTFFYHQALEQAEAVGKSADIKKEDFQYNGPKPHNREIAIVMIADAVEAASRSLQDPSYIKLDGLVKKIIYNKLNDGELEKSALNMSDLNVIHKAILRVLNGIFHTRIEYPQDDEIKKLENKVLENKNNGN